MNASTEPHELFGYRYILSTTTPSPTTPWCAENPIVLEIKIPQITRNAPASMYKRLVNMICLHFSLIEMYFSVNQDSEHCLKLLYIKKRKASKSTKKQLTTKSLIKKYCDDERLPVRYRSDPKKLDSQDFWDSIKIKNKVTCKLKQTLIHEIELGRSIILNPLSHATIVNIPRQELEDAMNAVEELKNELNPF